MMESPVNQPFPSINLGPGNQDGRWFTSGSGINGSGIEKPSMDRILFSWNPEVAEREIIGFLSFEKI